MRCISPLLIRSSGRRDFVPCGKCNFCLQVKRADWTFRLLQETRYAETMNFLTLTYDDGNVPINSDGDLVLCKRHVQLFQKRLRKENRKICEWPVRYYSVGEYGTRTLRPHYHSIMFNVHQDLSARISDIWSHGQVHVGDVNLASIHYVTKYVINRHQEYGGREPPFSLMSKRPGLGARYLLTHAEWHQSQSRNFTKVNGVLGRLPRYYKDKFFTAAERSRMAAECVKLTDVEYLETLERLSAFHGDPYHYYDERMSEAHERVTSKINSQNKF